MEIFAPLSADGYEEALVLHDAGSGLNGFLVVHDTTRGPALGGIRIRAYGSDQECWSEALRLARLMTLKTALAGLAVGGGKIVLRANAMSDRRRALTMIARYLELYGGRFYTAGDLGTTAEDIAFLRQHTRWCADETADGVGDLYLATARGVLHAVNAAVRHTLGKDSLEGLHIAIQGVGGVGARLVELASQAGARVSLADLAAARAASVAARAGARVVAPADILATACDVLAPCATSGVLDAAAIAGLRTRIVVPAANAVLAAEEHGAVQLAARAVVYVPDFVANAGAVIQGAGLLLDGRRESPEQIAGIAATTTAILAEAAASARNTVAVAEELALSRLARDKRPEDLYWPRR